MPAARIRPLTAADADAARALGAESFGYPAGPRTPAEQAWPPAGITAMGTFVGGRMVAHARVGTRGSWFGGRIAATAAVAGVAVAPEHRGHGLLAPLLGALLDAAAADGAVISTLYPTAPGVYRRAGYELVGELCDVEVPVSSLDRIRPAPDVSLERVEGDAVEVRDLYDGWAAQRNGPLARPRDRSFGAEGDHVTLARDPDGRARGYVRWRREDGYDAARSTVEVRELVAHTPEAGRALWRMLAEFGSAAAHVRLRTSTADPARLALPAAAFRPIHQWPYALRLLDVAAAFAARGTAPLPVSLPFTVVGDGLDGSHRLVTDAAGAAECTPAEPGGPVFTGAGIAMAWAGAHSCADLRAAGLLRGPDADDARWDALLHRGPISIRDYF